jgi:hypothetical protein
MQICDRKFETRRGQTITTTSQICEGTVLEKKLPATQSRIWQVIEGTRHTWRVADKVDQEFSCHKVHRVL